MDNVIIISDHVNRVLISFKESGKPPWSASKSVKLADRYAQAWHQNQKWLARKEEVLNEYN